MTSLPPLWPGGVHPAALAFPEIVGEEFTALVEDIRANGLLNPIIIDDKNVLLDGRNRLRAWIELGNPATTIKRHIHPGDPLDLIVSSNLRRRHLTETQLFMVGIDLLPQYEARAAERKKQAGVEAQKKGGRGRPADRVEAGRPQPYVRVARATDEVAADLGTSGRGVRRAKRVVEQAPELAQPMREGTMTAWEAEKILKQRKRDEARDREKAQQEQAVAAGTTFEIRRGDFRVVLADLPNDSIDLVITDPPYGHEATHLYADLARFAAEKLKPGGSCVAYVGQANLPGVLEAMSEHLRYWWTLALVHNHGSQQLPGKWVMIEWKPLVWFVKDHRAGRNYVADRLSGSKPRKDLHEWAQGVDEVAYLIEKLSEPGGLIVDPFAGSGSFGHAARNVGRHFLGAESGDHEDAR